MKVFADGKEPKDGESFGGSIGQLEVNIDETELPDDLRAALVALGQRLTNGKDWKPSREGKPYGDRLIGVNLIGISFSLILAPEKRR